MALQFRSPGGAGEVQRQGDSLTVVYKGQQQQQPALQTRVVVKDISQFNVEDVCKMIMSIGLDPNPFYENAVEGEDLMELTDKEFEEYLNLKPLQVRKLRKKLRELQEGGAEPSNNEPEVVETPNIFQKYQKALSATPASPSDQGGYSAPSSGGYGQQAGSFGGDASSQSSRFTSVDHRAELEKPKVDYSMMQPCERGLMRGVYAADDQEVAPPDATFEQQMFSGQSTGIDFEKYSSIEAHVTGNNLPQPINTFAEARFHPVLLENIQKAKYKNPTPVQRYGIAVVLAGRDLMACAQTGSGKTAAFLFPIISLLLNRGRTQADLTNQELGSIRKAVYPDCTIISPTRELSLQIYDECRKFAYRSYLRPCVVYGGADPKSQVMQLKEGCHILVATPGRLNQMIERRHIFLSRSMYLILDEADRMLDMGFEPQIRQIIQERDLPETGKRQTLMFSATFPREIQQLAGEFLHDYIFLTVGRVGAASGTIRQIVDYVEETDKHENLLNQLNSHRNGLTLVFVQTKKQVDTLEEFLKRQGFPATSLSGDRFQYEREKALEDFKTGVTPVMVATDVAQRGLDIPNVQHVINFDMPANIDDYVHRIGRTGRAGNTGLATSFFNDQDTSLAADLVEVLQETNQVPPDWLKQVAGEATGGRSRYKPKDARGLPRGMGGGQGGFSGGDSGFGGSSSFDSGSSNNNTGGTEMW